MFAKSTWQETKRSDKETEIGRDRVRVLVQGEPVGVFILSPPSWKRCTNPGPGVMYETDTNC